MFHFKVLKLTQYQGDPDFLIDKPETPKTNQYRQVIPEINPDADHVV